MEVLAVIPARGGSKRLPRKNIKLLAGRPLIAYTIDAARECKLITRIVVSTEDAEIAAVARGLGVEVIDRPRKYATDWTPSEFVLEHCLHEFYLRGYDPNIVVLLQPTSPIRKEGIIDACIRQVADDDNPHFAYSTSGQGADGQCYAWRKKDWTGACIGVGILSSVVVDIDTQEDFERAEAILHSRSRSEPQRAGA